MTFEQLQYFLAVELYMNFSTAAANLCISQSSLSKHIKALESELFVSLFTRNTRNIKLTPAGMAFSVHAKHIMQEHTKMLCELKEYSTKRKHSLSISSIPVMNQYGLTSMILSFKKEYPDVDLNIYENDSQYVIKSLESFNTDLAILRSKNLQQDKYNIVPLIKDELVLVVHKDHPFANQERIHLYEAANENFILLSTDNCVYNTCIEECAKVGFVPHAQHTNIRVETIKSFVAQGLGVSLLMERIAKYLADPDIRIINLKEPPMLTLSIVTRKETISKVSTNFIQFAVDYFKTEQNLSNCPIVVKR